MKENIKHFKNYSLFLAIILFITGVLGILVGLGMLIGSFFILLASSVAGPLFGVIAFLIYFMIGLLYIAISAFCFVVGIQYLHRGNEAQELLDVEDGNSERKLQILKSIERREFWIERLFNYPSLYGGALLMILTVVFLPLGIFMLFSAENQRKMDLLKDKYNFTSEVPSLDTRITNSEDIFEQIKKKTKFDAWGIISSVLSLILLTVLMVAGYLYIAPQVEQQLRTSPNNMYKNIPSEFER
jgi:amino acid transporter